MTTDKRVILGIDLGTTYSCVAVWQDGAAVVIPSASGRTMPSWVSWAAVGGGDGRRVVGAAAKAAASASPTNTVFDVKRILGRAYHDPVVQAERQTLPYQVKEGAHGEPTIVLGNGTEWSPEQISAMVLGELRQAAQDFLGPHVHCQDAVITVPAHFNNLQRQATKIAGQIAGLNVVRIINEPTAAALAYGLHDGAAAAECDKPAVLIFDLGGGTFDVSCLEMADGIFEVKATGGDTHLGGQDLDQTVVQWAVDLFDRQYPGQKKPLLQSKQSMAKLKAAVEQAKKELSSTPSVPLRVDNLLAGRDFSTTLDQATFQKLNQKLFEKCLTTVQSVLQDAQTELHEVTDIVLVGGSTRVPYLQDLLYKFFHKRIALCKKLNPDECVAMGAAVQGFILASGGTGGGQALATQDDCTELLLLDVTPLSLGIELQGRVMSTLIKRNEAIPCKKTRTYSTVEDFQTSIDVVVYEGERACVDSNNQLGSFVISGIQSAKKGEPKIDVSFSLDANGILSVSAKDQVTNAEASTVIKNEKGRLSEADIERMVQEAEQYRAQDKKLAEKHAFKNKLEAALVEAKAATTDEDDMKELVELADWMKLDSDEATMEDMLTRSSLLKEKYGISCQA